MQLSWIFKMVFMQFTVEISSTGLKVTGCVLHNSEDFPLIFLYLKPLIQLDTNLFENAVLPPIIWLLPGVKEQTCDLSEPDINRCKMKVRYLYLVLCLYSEGSHPLLQNSVLLYLKMATPRVGYKEKMLSQY